MAFVPGSRDQNCGLLPNLHSNSFAVFGHSTKFSGSPFSEIKASLAKNDLF